MNQPQAPVAPLKPVLASIEVVVPRAEVSRAKFCADILPLLETVKNPGAD
jgi:hypothetical protein